jgi:methyl-accepting chemotaxis protein
MNWDESVEAHVKWKIKLQAYINVRGEKLDANTIAKDNACALGQWLSNEASKLQGNATFQTLKGDHSAFHKAAADVVKKVDAGDKAGATALMGSGSEFMTKSMKVVGGISAIRKSV